MTRRVGAELSDHSEPIMEFFCRIHLTKLEYYWNDFYFPTSFVLRERCEDVSILHVHPGIISLLGLSFLRCRVARLATRSSQWLKGKQTRALWHCVALFLKNSHSLHAGMLSTVHIIENMPGRYTAHWWALIDVRPMIIVSFQEWRYIYCPRRRWL